MEELNSKLLAFDYSFSKATVSKEAALRADAASRFERRFGAELAPPLELSSSAHDCKCTLYTYISV